MINAIHELFGIKETQGNAINLHLLIVDYLPVTRIIDNLELYGFIDVASENMDVYFKQTIKSKSILKMTLSEVLEEFKTLYLCKRAGVLAANEVIVNHFNKPTRFNSLNAVLITSMEMTNLRELVLDDNTSFRLMDFEPTTEQCSTLKNFYNSYMLYANIVLTDYTFMTKTTRTKDCPLIFLLDEFVPLIYEFRGIDNPLFRVQRSITYPEQTTDNLYRIASKTASIGSIFNTIWEQKVLLGSNEAARGYFVTFADLQSLFPYSIKFARGSFYNRALMVWIIQCISGIKVAPTYMPITIDTREANIKLTAAASGAVSSSRDTNYPLSIFAVSLASIGALDKLPVLSDDLFRITEGTILDTVIYEDNASNGVTSEFI